MKSRRYFLVQSALATTGLLLTKPFKLFGSELLFTSFGKGNDETVTLLHTNDLHSHLTPLTHDTQPGVGGFEKTAGVISRIKNEHGNVVLLDAGDIFCGNILHQKEHETLLKGMCSAGYDAALLGNRDYEAGTDYLQEQWQKNAMPLVTSNYSYKNSRLKDLHQPYKIVKKGNIKVGIVGAGIRMQGLVPAHVNHYVHYKDPAKELTGIATMLKQEEKCHLVVCLSHLGFKNKKTIDDITLATQSKNIDVIIGGHSHTFMQAPHIVLNQQQQEVIINHAGYGGIVLGNMIFSFDGYGNKNKVIFNNLMVGAKDHVWMNKQRKAMAS